MRCGGGFPVVCGAVDSGKSSTTGRLIYDLGGISERQMQKLQASADELNKSSFAFAFLMDGQKEERQRGITITATIKEFQTETKRYAIIDAPGHRDFIKNMVTGAAQADVGLLLIPADSNFAASLQASKPKQGQMMGQSRQHALLLNLLGIKQLVVGINKMDVAGPKGAFSQARFEEVRDETISVLVKIGWKRAHIDASVAFIPFSGMLGDNLVTPSTNMPWWTGQTITRADGTNVSVTTILDVLDKAFQAPNRDSTKALRMAVNGVCSPKGVGTVVTGHIEQGTVTQGDEVRFVCTGGRGKVLSIEKFHKSAPFALPGDAVGIVVRGLSKFDMPKCGDVLVAAADPTMQTLTKTLTVQLQVLHHPGELKVGYTPIAFIRTGRSPVKMTAVEWRMGKETGGVRLTDKASCTHLKAGDVAQVQFAVQAPLVADTFQSCAGFGRIAIFEGTTVVMIGKVVGIEQIEDASA